MSSNEKPTTRATLGLGGLTMNAMALIAPGAFLWLTFFIQSAYGAPMAAQGMWFGIFAALVLCLATAIAYAELSKLYPGAGSSYFFAEQAFLSKAASKKFARVAKLPAAGPAPRITGGNRAWWSAWRHLSSGTVWVRCCPTRSTP